MGKYYVLLHMPKGPVFLLNDGEYYPLEFSDPLDARTEAEGRGIGRAFGYSIIRWDDGIAEVL